MKDFVIFVNVTKQCNVNCQKCYLTEENRKINFFLEESTLEKLFSAKELSDAESVLIIWEGGEASLAGYNKLKSYSNLLKKHLPNAKQTMVTNLLVMPDWLIKLCKEEYNSKFETTLALNGKYTLSGSRDKYLEKFEKSLKKVVDNNIHCTVNIELNKDTVSAGALPIIEMANRTGNKYWEFDLSVDFQSFLANPVYNLYTYPVLPLQSTFKEVADYFLSYIENHKQEYNLSGMEITSLDYLVGKVDNLSFNVSKDLNFITINPDGVITSNPLFSDLTHTYLGNIINDDFSKILSSKGRRLRARYERARTVPCVECPFYDKCGSGASHVPVIDGSGECAGFFNARKKLMGLNEIPHPLKDIVGFKI